MQAKPKKKKPPDPALFVTTMHSTLCFPLCLRCAVPVELNLPSPVLSCSALEVYSKFASSHRPIQFLQARSPAPFCFHPSFGRISILSRITVFGVFVDFLYPLEEVFRSEFWPWRLSSLGLSSPVFSVGCGDLVGSGCRRSSISVIVQIARSWGSRSVLIESLDHEWLTRSVSFASFCSFFPRKAQVCYYLPLLFHIALIDFIRALFSLVLRPMLLDSSVSWNGLLSLTLLWRWLSLSWPIHVDIYDVGTFWCSSWHIGVTKSCNLRIWSQCLFFWCSCAKLNWTCAYSYLLLTIIDSMTLVCCDHVYAWFMVLVLHSIMLDHSHQGFCSKWWLVSLTFSTKSGLSLPGSRFCFLVTLSCGLEPSEGASDYRLVFSLTFSASYLSCSVFPVGSIFLICVWLWWQGLCALTPIFQLLCMRPSCLFCLEQHIQLLRLHHGMVGNPLHGGGLFNFMMSFCAIESGSCAYRLDCHLFGVEIFPRSADTYWWLWNSVSLIGDVSCNCKRPQIKHTFQVNEYILLRPERQMQENKRVIGTHDQVLGNSTYMFWLYFDKCWDYMIEFFLLPIVIDKDVNWLSAVSSSLLYICNLWFVWIVAQHSCVLGPCLTALEQHRRVLGPCLMALDQHLMMLGQVLALQVMLIVDRVQCLHSHSVNCIPGCCTPSGISCNSSNIRILEQHLCVLGLCLVALELHPWMPSPAHCGCCLFRCCALVHSHRSYLLAMQIVRCALQSLITVCMTIVFASLWFKGYFTNCLQ